MRTASEVDMIQYFRILGRLLLELDHPVDLVLLDRRDPFGLFLQEHQELVQID